MNSQDSMISIELREKVEHHMNQCGYADGTIKMKLGNLNFLFGHYGQDKMLELLNSRHDTVYKAIEFIQTTLPQGCIITSDVQAFKLAWESVHGIEIIKKRVSKNTIK